MELSDGVTLRSVAVPEVRRDANAWAPSMDRAHMSITANLDMAEDSNDEERVREESCCLLVGGIMVE